MSTPELGTICLFIGCGQSSAAILVIPYAEEKIAIPVCRRHSEASPEVTKFDAWLKRSFTPPITRRMAIKGYWNRARGEDFDALVVQWEALGCGEARIEGKKHLLDWRALPMTASSKSIAERPGREPVVANARYEPSWLTNPFIADE